VSILLVGLGVAIILIVLGDAFETIVLPRRVTRPISLARLFYQYTWLSWSVAVRSIYSGKRQETYLSFYGPLSLLLLLILWATGLIIGFAVLLWASGSAIKTPEGTATFSSYLYLSGTTFFTLGLGDVIPNSPLGSVLSTKHIKLYHKGVITSPTLYDPNTLIGRSDSFVIGIQRPARTFRLRGERFSAS